MAPQPREVEARHRVVEVAALLVRGERRSLSGERPGQPRVLAALTSVLKPQ